jgi:hypothetical protein
MREWFSQEHIQALILNLAQTRGDKGFTKDEAEALVQWVYQAMCVGRLQTCLLRVCFRQMW